MTLTNEQKAELRKKVDELRAERDKVREQAQAAFSAITGHIAGLEQLLAEEPPKA